MCIRYTIYVVTLFAALCATQFYQCVENSFQFSNSFPMTYECMNVNAAAAGVSGDSPKTLRT